MLQQEESGMFSGTLDLFGRRALWPSWLPHVLYIYSQWAVQRRHYLEVSFLIALTLRETMTFPCFLFLCAHPWHSIKLCSAFFEDESIFHVSTLKVVRYVCALFDLARIPTYEFLLKVREFLVETLKINGKIILAFAEGTKGNACDVQPLNANDTWLVLHLSFSVSFCVTFVSCDGITLAKPQVCGWIRLITINENVMQWNRSAFVNSRIELFV